MLYYLQHVILTAQIGTRDMQKRIATYSKIYREISNQVTPISNLYDCLLGDNMSINDLQKSLGGSLNAGGGAFGVSASGEVGLDLKTLNKNANELNQVDDSTVTAHVGSEEIPAPIKLELTPIAEVLSKSAWGPTWDDYGIDARQRNLKEALNFYPVHVGAQIGKGIIVIDISTSAYHNNWWFGSMIYMLSIIIINCRSYNKCFSQVDVVKWNICLTSTSIRMP
jgi:hypothetical protein